VRNSSGPEVGRGGWFRPPPGRIPRPDDEAGRLGCRATLMR